MILRICMIESSLTIRQHISDRTHPTLTLGHTPYRGFKKKYHTPSNSYKKLGSSKRMHQHSMVTWPFQLHDRFTFCTFSSKLLGTFRLNWFQPFTLLGRNHQKAGILDQAFLSIIYEDEIILFAFNFHMKYGFIVPGPLGHPGVKSSKNALQSGQWC